ncbi:MAG: aminomethyl-transferring glycine dehydrogenase [Candidatus Promineofilum sp.]|nr:aminomethyl-transferring glycine dehydrogenase [Promineifilum sp.]MCW5863352.1 aminomethyl-transferring glycine dehydrogenase [Anaerolineae bacterium]
MTTASPRANWQDIIEAHAEGAGSAPQLSNRDLLMPADRFVKRHIGPRSHDVSAMLGEMGLDSLDKLVEQAIPAAIRMDGLLNLDPPRSEQAVLEELRELAGRNKIYRSYIGMGYYDTILPPVIQRNILENPGWYTAYTPYQPEISQGRLEALINFQTMVCDLTGMEIANASLLDEGTAAAEAMTLCQRARLRNSKANVFFVSELVHPQTLAVVRTRAEPLGIKVVVGRHEEYDFAEPTFGVLVQYPATNGDVYDYKDFAAKSHTAGALVVAATDLLALVLLTPPGEWGADVALGNSQRFGVPMGYGGPHAAFFATRDEYKRIMAGRLVGVSVDATGKKGYRLTLTTREQHIRREKATSNICTAQVLLAVIASMYAVYHGPVGLKRIATRVRLLTGVLAAGLRQLGYRVNETPVFDTLTISGGRRNAAQVRGAAEGNGINLRYSGNQIGVSLDETTTVADLEALLAVFGAAAGEIDIPALADDVALDYEKPFQRGSAFLTHPVFNSYLSETEMMRYIKRLENRDISLVHSMIPLGSCTMKLNAAAEMLSITLPGFAHLHPFVPLDQAQGYAELFRRLESWLTEITGFAGCSLQPNSGAQGEYTGMLTIRAYQIGRGQGDRHICLIPASAHGTNPASAALAGMEVVVVATDDHGNVAVDDLRAKAEQHRDHLAALMITYPSTHGVYERGIRDICKIVHDNGGQVYMDGANMNALVGVARPGDFGPDVLHLNLHKTFTIPHGGGGPGVGPICVAAHLTPYLPNHPVVPGVGGEDALGTVASAPWGSASILPIPYAYIALMGEWGLQVATEIAILNANYIATKLESHYPVLYRGANGRVAHECIVDPRHLKDTAGVTAEDITKRLMDFGFHAPTLSFPVPGTLMIEPTESESKAELDRFIDAMILIREEIRAIEEGRMDHDNNPLKHAPHTAEVVLAEAWERPYSREQAAYPADWVRAAKVWPYVSRIDNVYGDRNLFCVCIPIEEYA